MTILQIAGLLAVAALCALAYAKGYNSGVDDTEERWSDVVAKANYQRDMERRTQ